MPQFRFLILLAVFAAAFPGKAQSTNDSATYWVNTAYLAALDSGKSVAQCEKEHPYLMLDLDSLSGSLLIVPSVYTSWESFSFSISASPLKENFYFIADAYGLDSGSFLRTSGKTLGIYTRKNTFIFRQMKFLRTEKNADFDMRNQIARLNAKPLLSYSVKPCEGEKPFLTQAELAAYYSKGMLSLNCPDDFNYNELSIKDQAFEFFLVYQEKKITLYKMPLRDRGETVDTSKLKECEILYKPN